MRCGIYVRASTDEQSDNGYSIDSQLRMIKEIGARTKRAMKKMALEKIHPSKAPYGYIRNSTTGHLEIEPIEAQVVKEIFKLCKQGNSTRSIATIMRNNNAYLKTGKWTSDSVYKILTNSIYIGIFEYGKYKRKPQNVLKVENYCELIIDIETWKATRKVLKRNKHSNYGKHIHLFTGIIRCPTCGKILAFSFVFNSLNRQSKKELIKRLIDKIEIRRTRNYDIEITKKYQIY